MPAASPSYYVWLEYTLRNGPQQKRMADFLGNALVPALNRLGSTPVGVFESMVGDPGPTISVLDAVRDGRSADLARGGAGDAIRISCARQTCI